MAISNVHQEVNISSPAGENNSHVVPSEEKIIDHVSSIQQEFDAAVALCDVAFKALMAVQEKLRNLQV